METAQFNLFLLFGVIIVVFLLVDLGVFNKKSHKIDFKSALYQSLFWILISVAFAFLVSLYLGNELAAQFMGAYVTEKMLSLDNLFVIMLIFSYFKLEEKYHHRALFFGILGAIIFRAIFIGAGSIIVSQFHWVLYIFGLVLLYTGFKLLGDKKEEHVDFEKNQIIKLARKFLPFTTKEHHGKFFIRENKRTLFTSLFLTVLLIEATDIIFAVDSIPAAFSISQNAFIVFTSNIFAVLGMRSLFFVVEGFINRFHHLQKGLAIILIFVGGKMLLGIFGLHISSLASFAFIIAIFGASLLTSLYFPKKL
ncbi:MAG: TerC/Alx family metal homeostasis membrane protein [Candidatus Moraniibacteriota bacterium]